MTKGWIIATAGLSLAACGSVSDLQPAAGRSLPQKPALAQRALTAEELLTAPPFARPERVDELGKRGEPRKPDRFDLPPPDGTAAPAAPAAKPSSASTAGPEDVGGPDNAGEPKR